MIFTTREDIEAPIDFVFAQLSDFAAIERSILRRGAEIQRKLDHTPPAAGMIWDTSFQMKGKRRQLEVTLVTFEPPAMMRFEGIGKSLTGDLVVELVALSRGRTRVALTCELKAKNLSARLMLQSLKLARGNVTKRFEMRVASYAKELEERYMRNA
ncbi:SRPBCC family protein [Roseovarius nanhaiticus]|uniref:SRPBCC family protein n=1 Tax=Roseovarius nanhaiticus TaxID=573024 RepID=UPI0024903B0D|nr:SRPBCC family protein [Roseovarius nanhaiticus]